MCYDVFKNLHDSYRLYFYITIKGAGINTNMFVEAFHNTLKQVYMRGRVNRRVDRSLHLLLRLARDKAFDRLVKLEKGKTTSRLSGIHARHKASLELSSGLVAHYGLPLLYCNILCALNIQVGLSDRNHSMGCEVCRW